MNTIFSMLKRVWLISGFLFLSACSTTVQYMQPEVMASENAAKIYINRPSNLWGSALRAPIYINGNYIGRIGNGGQLVWIVKPGMVTISTSEGTLAVLVEKSAPHTISFKAEKGKTYYVKVIAPYQLQFAAPTFGSAAFELELMKGE